MKTTTQKTELWTVIWDVIKFILTLGISHINKRKEKINSNHQGD